MIKKENYDRQKGVEVMAKKGTSSVKMPMTGQHKMSGGHMMDNKTMNKIMGTSTKKKGK